MWKQGLVLAAALCAAVGFGGCASGGSPGGMDAEAVQPAPAGKGSVIVHNNNWAEVDVYAVRDGLRLRLGSVTTAASARFVLPAAVLAGGRTLQLLIDPIGSRTGFLTQPLVVGPGQQVVLQIENNLNLTSYSVF